MELQLRGFQEEAAESLRTNFRNGVRTQILCLPTGAGKTMVAVHLLQQVRSKGKRAVFVVDRLSLVEQTSLRLHQYGIPHGIIQGNNVEHRPWEKIQVASAQTLARRKWPDVDLILVDECHSRYEDTTRRVEKRDVLTVGLTATPFAKGLGRTYQAVVTATTTNWLIQNGFLAPFRIFAASAPDMTGVKVSSTGEWDSDESATRAMPIIGDCVAEYLKHADGKKFICFGVNVAHCEEIQRQFMAAGVLCGLYTYQSGDTERADAVKEFRKPDSCLRGLISVSALAKGFDVEDVEVIILARPLRKSLAEHIQMIGRGLRTDPNNPAKVCTILDHANNCTRFWGPMQEFFEEGKVELDDGTKKEAKPKEAAEKTPRKCPQCHHVHDPKPFCPACGFAYTRQSDIAHVAGELSEVSSVATRENKQAFYSELLSIARQKGRSSGWVANTYRDKFGVWPRGLVEIPKSPTRETERWVQHRLIAFAKSGKFRSRAR